MKLNKNHLHIFDDRPLDCLADFYAAEYHDDDLDALPDDFNDVHDAMLKRFHATKTLTIESELERFFVWNTIYCSIAACSMVDYRDENGRPRSERPSEYTAMIRAGRQLERWHNAQYPDNIVEFPIE